MNYTTVKCVIEDDGIAIVSLNRPEILNVLSNTMCKEATQLLKSLEKDPNVRAIVLTGEGRAFCAGLDLSEIRTGEGDTVSIYRRMEAANSLIILLSQIMTPIVAAVNGVATASGMNLCLACDLVVASRNAKFSQNFGHVGLIPDVGGAYLLPRIAGVSKAKEIIFLDRELSAEEAQRLDIVTQLVEPEQVMDTAKTLARKMAAGPSFAFSIAKKMLGKCEEMDITTALHMESLSQALLTNTEDHKKGMEAFFARRKK
jgi:2-(1,2-epoxy-1,2-dihydrophenyl)acetyl-CoA isomerase